MLRLASTYAAVGLSVAAAYLVGVHGETPAALAVGLVAAVFIALRVSMMDWRPHVSLLDAAPRGVKVMGKRTAALALVGMLVTTSTVAPVGAATGDQCSTLDGFIYDILNFQPFDGNADNPCSTRYQVNSAIEDMEQSDANQTKTDIYSAGTSVKAQEEVFKSTYGNYLNDSQSVAWMKAQVAVAEAYENGSSKAQARIAAKEAIADYYATRQINFIEQWNVSQGQIWTLYQQAEQEDGISTGSLGYITFNDPGDADPDRAFPVSVQSQTMTLVNGTTYDAHLWRVQNGNGPDAEASIGLTKIDYSGNLAGAYIKGPDSNYEDLQATDFYYYYNTWPRFQTLNDNLQSEADNFVNATYDDFASGEINASDVISANTAMFEYGTETGDNSSLYSSTAALALMGFDTPNLNSSGLMNVTYQGQTYQGLVLARSAPGGAWTANTTYNTSNITGPVFLAASDGEKVDFDDNTDFTINGMVSKDGTKIQTQNTTKYVYKTANTSELLEMQRQLTELRAEIEAREASAGGGGGGIPPLSTENKALIALVAVAVIVVMRG
ncbi:MULTISPECIES: hypothetical protein [unclassified Haloferax]|uniref:hypothetical protein n=1 Tax=unclassified Haloferax TaxID=2625095 RepID=UPI002874E1DB|nr:MULTISPECIES: hypothetical protein [unclassified Haloferax]MDS0241796.1 hypothetical protein [Haloferax sp. S2CR25]MDS0444917.1 hypothetical protein [Haloferax sp. S2CR25-2]